MGYPVARVGNLVKVGSEVGKIITGASAHTVDGAGGGGQVNVVNGLVVAYGDLEAEAMLGPNSDDGDLQNAIENGEVEKSETDIPVDPDATPAAVTPVSCNGITGNEGPDFVLGNGFTLGQLSSQVSYGSGYGIRSQMGLSKSQIICNLRQLVNNTLIPISNHFGRRSFVINSGFRHASGSTRSQHPRGQAADLHFIGKNPTQVLAIAGWIRDNINYDQLILERGGGYWIHVSFSTSQQRRQSFSIDTRRNRPKGQKYDTLRLMP